MNQWVNAVYFWFIIIAVKELRDDIISALCAFEIEIEIEYIHSICKSTVIQMM